MAKTTCQAKIEVLKRVCLPSRDRVYLASGEAALGRPHHVTRMGDIVTHTQSSFLQRASRRKAGSWCSKKALQRPGEKTACTGGNQPSNMEQEASERDSWRSLVRKASSKFETEWHEVVKERQRRQKERAAFLSSSAQTFACLKCSRICASRIGLYSHQRACKN